MAGYYPPVGFHFSVSFPDLGTGDNDTLFQSVGGLSVDLQTESVKEGGENRFEHVLPVRTKYANLTLKRGLLTDSEVLLWLMDSFQSMEFYPTDILVSLLNESHEPLFQWNVVHAWPKKWSVADLNAEASSAVIETLEFQYHYFTVG